MAKTVNRLVQLIKQDDFLQPFKTAAKITVIYTVFALIWFFLSGSIFQDAIAEPVKVYVYVFGSSLMLLGFITFALRESEKHDRCQEKSYGELKKLHSQLGESEKLLRQQLEDNRIYQNQLHYLAYYDALTDLPNRLSLQRDLQTALELEEQLALLFVDLDNFRSINDFRGHDTGDLLLKEVAKRLAKIADTRGTVYRFGGDEFIIVVPCPSQVEAQQLAREITIGFREPVRYKGSQLYVSASIGLVHTKDGGYLATDLIRFADLAMNDSKKRGGNCTTTYYHALSEGTIDQALLEQQLRTVFEQGQLSLYYQPEVELGSQQILGFEALLRWQPQQAIAATVEEIINTAERTGLIIPIGEWILKEACTFLRKIHNQGFAKTCISVNISIVQFSRHNFAQKVKGILKETGLKPNYLRLEITESVFMESYDLIAEQIEALRKIGVKMALDDFGKGYSSLSYLKLLPLDMLKIDKSFIDLVAVSSKDASLTSQIIAIGQNLDLIVVAEGVESQEQLDYLQKHGCHRFQGYYYSPPVPETAAISLLKKQNSQMRNRAVTGK